ncbi:hypothetical protein PITC_049770 [Penicillium italicum]|uniref:Uncharacterized protein n=1 Tax=Penicillium italicum TaxID=40296 RepID=A0A0A2KGV7_PENIT|nr:hypothetical protein PITC_049770 [Penicillium italicum]
MSSKTQVQETSQHLLQRQILAKLENEIESLDVHKLDATQLKKFNVKLYRMILDQNSELKPHFFALRPNLPKPSKDLVNGAYLIGDPEHCFTYPYARAYAVHTKWNSYAFHEIDRGTDNPWRSKE